MDIAKLVIEYLKVLLSAPPLFSVVAIIFIFIFREDLKALILRIAKIKLPGGTEVSTPQSNQLAVEENKPAPERTVNEQVPVAGLPADLTPQQRTAVEQLIRLHIATSYVWEYRYLNYFLARGTQHVLDWLIGQQSTTYAHFESVWIPIIPSANERQAIITVLQAHHLTQQEGLGLIVITPKGCEYAEWRGPLPPLSNR
ncbi:MAG: hypothetical protein WCL46_10525 [Chlorobium sp.]